MTLIWSWIAFWNFWMTKAMMKKKAPQLFIAAAILSALCSYFAFRLISGSHLKAEESYKEEFSLKDERYSDRPLMGVQTMVQKGHSAIVEEVHFTLDEKRMLSIDGEGGARLWDTAGTRLIAFWVVQPEYLNIVGFDRRGAIVGLRKGWQYVLNPLDGSTIDKFPVIYAHRENTKIFSGSMYAATWQTVEGEACIAITLWDIGDNEALATIPFRGSPSFNISVAPGGTYASITWGDNQTWNVQIYNIFDGRLIRRGVVLLDEGDEALDLTQAALHPEGKLLVVPEEEKQLRILDGQTFQWRQTIEGSAFMPLFALQFDRTGRYCIFKNDIYGYTEVVDLINHSKILDIDEEQNAWLSPSSRYLVTSPANPGGMWIRYTGYGLNLTDLQQGRTRRVNEEAHWVMDMALSADGRFLAVVEETRVDDYPTRIVKCFDLVEAREVWRLSGRPRALASEDYDDIDDYREFKYQDCILSDDGRRLMVQTNNGAVYVYDLPAGRLLYHLRGHLYVGHGLSPDGKYLAVTSLPAGDLDDFSFKRVTVVDIESKKAVQTFKIKTVGEIHHAAFSTDNRYLACVADNRVDVRLNEMAIAELKAELDHLKFTSNFFVWDLQTGQKVTQMTDQRYDIWPLAFNRGATCILSGRQIYRLSDGEKLQTFSAFGEIAKNSRGPFQIHSDTLAMNPESPHYVQFVLNQGVFKIKSRTSHELLATLYDFKNGLVMVTPDGYFQGAGNYSDKVHFVKEGEEDDSQHYFKLLNRPDYVDSRIDGKVQKGFEGPIR
jgi:WD40 repeat protein